MDTNSTSFDPYQRWLGIPPSRQPPDHYELLGISRFESDVDRIQKAADKRVAFLQDVANGPNIQHSQKILNEVARAVLCLKNAKKKRAYDLTLQASTVQPSANPSRVAKPDVSPTPFTSPLLLIVGLVTICLIVAGLGIWLVFQSQPHPEIAVLDTPNPVQPAVSEVPRSDPAPDPTEPASETLQSETPNTPRLPLAESKWIPQDESLISFYDLTPDRRNASTLKASVGLDAMIFNNVVAVEDDLGFRFDGESHLHIGTTAQEAGLTDRSLSIETWVLVDKPLRWGSFFSAIQDNGNFERGICLGYQNSLFSFGICSEKVLRLTYLTSSSEFELGKWYHVLGTYDGERMCIYVDGVLMGESTEQSGKVLYPDSCPVVIGAYKDDDEFFPLTGAIGLVAVYDRALSEVDVRKRFDATRIRYQSVGKRP